MRTSAGYLYMDKKKFHKAAISIEQQIALLKQRHLTITDDTTTYSCLESVSFHRLSAYFSPFENNHQNRSFKKGTAFQHVWNLYVFDRELRLLVLDVLERIEVALRTALSNQLALKHGPCWYTDDSLFKSSWPENLHNKNYSPKDAFFSELDNVCRNKKHNEEIKNYFKKYNSPTYPPSWIVLEYLSFGKCTNLFRYLRSRQDKANTSAIFGVHHKIFESALEPLRYARNLCAHHSRLWDRWFVYKSRNLKELKQIDCPPGTLKELLVLSNLFLKKLSPQSSWKEHLFDLFARYEEFVPFKLTGFNENWSSDLFWDM